MWKSMWKTLRENIRNRDLKKEINLKCEYCLYMRVSG